MSEQTSSKYLILPIWIIALLSLGALIHSTPNIFLWLVCSFFLLALLEPSWQALLRRKVPPSFAAVILIIMASMTFLLLLSILGYFSAGILFDLQESKRTLIQYFNSLNENIQSLIEKFSSAMNARKTQKIELLDGSFLSGEIGTTLMHGVGSAVTVLTYVILVPILTLFMMLGRNNFGQVFPLAFRDRTRAKKMWMQIVAANQAFFLGNLALAMVSFPLFAILFYIFAVKSPLTMAALSSVFNLVPFLGAALAGFLPTLDLLSQNATVPASLGLFGSCVLLHFVVANFITPRVLGSKVDLNAVISTVAIIVWGELWGPIGIILAIPITACIKIIFENSGYAWLHWIAALMSDKPAEILKLKCGRSEGLEEVS